jgi:Protein of unknown function (DUF2975)
MTTHSVSAGETATNQSDLRRIAAVMCFAIAIGGALAEVALAWIWLSPDYVAAHVVPHLGLAGAPAALDFGTRLTGFFVCMIPLSVIFFASHQAYELFENFRLGNIFVSSAPVRLRRIGLSMLALAVLQPLTSTLLGLALTATNPDGQRILSIGFSMNDYMFGLFGGLILAIAHVMVEAARMAEDHRQII